MILKCKRHPKYCFGRNYDRCLRPYNYAGSERLRLRMLVDMTAWSTASDGNYLAALKMIKMQGGVFGAVAHSEAFIGAIQNGQM